MFCYCDDALFMCNKKKRVIGQYYIEIFVVKRYDVQYTYTVVHSGADADNDVCLWEVIQNEKLNNTGKLIKIET